MSVFDSDLIMTNSQKFNFFHKFSKNDEPFLHKKILFECPIHLLKKNNSLFQFYLKILDKKFVIFTVFFGIIRFAVNR